MSAKSKELVQIKKETADLVLNKVQRFQNDKELDLPPNYSPANALKSAWLVLQETVDKDKKPALSVCTKESVANALLDMVVQGLNPAKKQAYFIVRGNKLCLDRSYFGTKAVALRVRPDLDDIYAEVIYKGDELTFEIVRGKKIVEQHKQQFSAMLDENIVGAYAVAINKDGNPVRSEIMTIAQIRQAWKQSSMKPIDDNGNVKLNSTHAKFPGEMAKKTVLSRLAKHFINSSSDSDLVIESVRRTDDEAIETEMEAEVEENSHKEVIDIAPEASDNIQEVRQEDTQADNDDWMEDVEKEKDRTEKGPGF